MQGAYFTFDKTLKIFAEGFNPVYRENGDFWRLHLDYGKAGYPRELGVYSHLQDTPETVKTEDGLRIIYDSVNCDKYDVVDGEYGLSNVAATLVNLMGYHAPEMWDESVIELK